MLLQTSGTYGLARTVVRSTASWVDSFAHVSALCGLDASSRAWIPAPLGGTMNLFAAVHASYVGAVVADHAIDATHWFLTPAALARQLDEGAAYAGVTVVVAGDRLSAALRDRASDACLAVHHYYGAAELSYVAWGTCEDDLRAFPEVEIDSRDGEIRVRSPWLSEGYAEGTGGWRLDGDGFATVGDRGRLDGDVLRVEGRDDVVVTGGATVRVADVEGSLRAAATGALAVVGVPHPTLGAVVVAAVGNASDVDALRALSREVLAPSHQPRRWVHVVDFPLTSAGKVDRAALAASLSTSP